MPFKKDRDTKNRSSRIFTLEMLLFAIAVLACFVLGWQVINPDRSASLLVFSGLIFTISLVALIGVIMDPDSVRARQSDDMLKLSRQTLACMQGGLDHDSAQKICELLLPATGAVGISVTNKEIVLGYVGSEEHGSPIGKPIEMKATRETLVDGKMRVLRGAEEIGFPFAPVSFSAAIIVPLRVGRQIEGALEFCYHKPRNISATQISIAEGFGQLLSTQMAAEALEEQAKLATSMELKALQSQINPHFLFNTINTIASLIRTEPAKARMLLREFAVFYRRTLEDSTDLIPFSREMEQTTRYFAFEVARFGEDRVRMEILADPDVADMMVPPFLIQPLVENAVHHAMPSEGTLTITVGAEMEGDNLVLRVSDDGVGMTEQARQSILHPESSTGMGIAVKNVHDRMCGYFGPGTHMEVESELGTGTTILLYLNNAVIREYL